jgi:hypothetical protein
MIHQRLRSAAYLLLQQVFQIEGPERRLDQEAWNEGGNTQLVLLMTKLRGQTLIFVPAIAPGIQQIDEKDGHGGFFGSSGR